ncbi:hypothetical protein VB735_03500 [Halotia wernerae UHCC 0503]|nr:hypothetical protein [Halotia wernerae UHCC 0503]
MAGIARISLAISDHSVFKLEFFIKNYQPYPLICGIYGTALDAVEVQQQ